MSRQVAAGNEMVRVWSPYLLSLYGLGVLALLSRTAMSTWSGRRLRWSTQPIADSKYLGLIAEQARRMGFLRVPLVATCNRVSVPVVIGILKPMILLPPALLCGLDAIQVAAIVCHEMAHIQRFDPLVNLLQRFVESLLFFHPVTWWISRRISSERENCCDDLACVDCGSFQYAGALLQMAELCAKARGMQITPQLSTIGADGGNSSQLSCRIHRLLGEPASRPLAATRISWSITLGFVVVCCLSVFAFAANGDATTQQTASDGVNQGDARPADEAATSQPDEDGIYWSGRNKDDWIAGMKIIQRPTAGKPVLVVQYLLRNAKDTERSINLSVHGRGRSTVDVSAGNHIRAELAGGSWLEERKVVGNEVLQPDHWQTRFNFAGLDPGAYSVRFGPAFFVPVRDQVGTRRSIPFGLTLPIDIPGPGHATEFAAHEDAAQSYAALPIRWGEPVSGLRIGIVFLDTPKAGDKKFRRGDLAQAQLFVQNVSKQLVQCQFLLPHPMDGWGLNIDDADGHSVKRHQVYISMFSPLRIFSAEMVPQEIQPISGKLPKFREGNEDEGYVPELKHVEFRIDSDTPEQAEHSPPFTYGMPEGRYKARCFANLRRVGIPDADLSVETGWVRFEVGDVDDVAGSHTPLTVTAIDEQTEQPEAKYPYCVIDIEHLQKRSLADAIAAFNRQSRESPIGRFQSPITEVETLEAIETFTAQSHLPAAVKSTLRQIASSKELPATAYFRRFTRFDDGQVMHRVWWVRLMITGDAPPVYSVAVRSKSFSARSDTQMERQQHASGGLLLMNRVSSYFEVPPNILLLAEFPQGAEDRLIADAKAAIEGDANALQRVFQWEGVSDSTRQFVDSELQQLRQANITSFEIRPRNFKAKMAHWSAYQRYQPNLPIVGYLDIKYKPNASNPGPSRTLSLEMGRFGDELRLISYVTDGERKLPSTLGKGLSVSGQTEPLADGTYLLSTITTNPGTLLSAHLGNEEIWQREY